MVGLVEGRTFESMGDDDGLLTIDTTKYQLDDRNGTIWAQIHDLWVSCYYGYQGFDSQRAQSRVMPLDEGAKDDGLKTDFTLILPNFS